MPDSRSFTAVHLAGHRIRRLGEPTTASRILTIFGPTVIMLWLLIMGFLLLGNGRAQAAPSSHR
jgi:hypothetical protein